MSWCHLYRGATLFSEQPPHTYRPTPPVSKGLNLSRVDILRRGASLFLSHCSVPCQQGVKPVTGRHPTERRQVSFFPTVLTPVSKGLNLSRVDILRKRGASLFLSHCSVPCQQGVKPVKGRHPTERHQSLSFPLFCPLSARG
jgi:hypothetical protein